MAWLDIEAIPDVTAQGGEAVKRMAAALGGFRSETNPWLVLAQLLLIALDSPPTSLRPEMLPAGPVVLPFGSS